MFKLTILAALLAGSAAPVAGVADPTLLTQFSPSKFPTLTSEKESVQTSAFITLNGHIQQIKYHELARSGQEIGPDKKVFGKAADFAGNPVLGNETAAGARHAGDHMISDMEDFSSVLRSRSSDEHKLWGVTHFEDMPAHMQAMEMRQNEDGTLTPVKLYDVDFSADAGVVGTCAGSVSPWNTHLGGEEWGIPDAKEWEGMASIEDFGRYTAVTRYYGLYSEATFDDIKKHFNPYNHGYPNEVSIDDSAAGEPVISAVKHYAMGRYAIELPFCLPTSPQVCYVMDDKTNGLPCAFKPDNANDLSAGELLCAKVTQTTPEGEKAGSFTVDWISLGHATNKEIRDFVKAGAKFSDMFDTAAFDEDNFACPTDFHHVNGGGGNECLKVKAGMEKMASRLETRRYAFMLGASTEFTKMEGMTFSLKTLYSGNMNLWLDLNLKKTKFTRFM